MYSTTWGDSTSYEEKNISYDKNGNITHLLRTNQTGGTLNDFTYTYSETNQLKHLNVGGSYIYDSNGNMTTDGLKGFSVAYNLLNLPSRVSKNSENVSYIYSAAGAKLAKLQNSSLQQLYTGSLVYNGSKQLDYILHDEGMVKASTSGPLTFTYEYFMKDHLGNTRVVFNGSGNTLQVADYYPFGSRFVPFSPESSNKYLYNGKELQDDLIGGAQLNWLDYGARFYDSQIGRWMGLDPITEKYFDLTPYNYVANNPINLIDPDGRDWEKKVNEDGSIEYIVTVQIKNTANIDSDKLDEYVNDIKTTTENTFQGKDENGTKYKTTVVIDWKGEDNESADFYLDFVDKVKDVDGYSNEDTKTWEGACSNQKSDRAKNNRIQISVDNASDVGGTGAHELGHTGGLLHPDRSTGVDEYGNEVANNNIMYPYNNANYSVTGYQLKRISNTIDNGYSPPPPLYKPLKAR